MSAKKGGNFENIAPALRRTFAVALRHIYCELDTHVALPHQNVASFKSVCIVPIDSTDESAKKTHALTSLAKYPLWNDLSLAVQELLDAVPRGKTLVGCMGRSGNATTRKFFQVWISCECSLGRAAKMPPDR